MVTFFGPAGSGKSVQGQILAEKYGWRWMSVGELLRKNVDAEKAETMRRGALVDDHFVVNLMRDEMHRTIDAGEKAVIDGFPRNRWQADWLVGSGDIRLFDGAIILRVPNDELWRRLEARGRADDLSRESIELRWNIFHSEIAQILDILRAHGVKIAEVDGVGEMNEVADRIDSILFDWGLIDNE